ncbi:MAG: hypothetical protein WC677_07690 [Clostridia bacterium]
MAVNLKKAIAKYGTSDDITRWLLSDGQFLCVPDYEDHRIIGEFCTIDWMEFIAKGHVSLHFDRTSAYMSLRVDADLTVEQRRTFQKLYERDEFFEVHELYIRVHDGRDFQEALHIKGFDECKLWLTDIIAYNCAID